MKKKSYVAYQRDTCQAEPIRKNITQKVWTYNSILLATRASKRFSSRLFQRASGFRVSLMPPRNFSVPRRARNTSEYRITDRNDAMNIYPKVNIIIKLCKRKYLSNRKKMQKKLGLAVYRSYTASQSNRTVHMSMR